MSDFHRLFIRGRKNSTNSEAWKDTASSIDKNTPTYFFLGEKWYYQPQHYGKGHNLPQGAFKIGHVINTVNNKQRKEPVFAISANKAVQRAMQIRAMTATNTG